MQKGRGYRQEIRKRPYFLGREWLLNDRSYTDPTTGEAFPTSWKMTTEGDYLFFTYSQILYFIIEAEELYVQHVEWSIEYFFKPTDDSAQRAELVKIFGEVLVKKMMPFCQRYSSEQETKHRVCLVVIEKIENKYLLHMPQYGCVK